LAIGRSGGGAERSLVAIVAEGTAGTFFTSVPYLFLATFGTYFPFDMAAFAAFAIPWCAVSFHNSFLLFLVK